MPPSDVHRRLRPTLDAMARDMTRAWTLAELAKLVHLHPTYFSNLFRETVGVPPLRSLSQLPIRRARDLLRNTDARISEVAARCGYDNPLHFSRVVHRATGVCPREFRARGGGIVP